MNFSKPRKSVHHSKNAGSHSTFIYPLARCVVLSRVRHPSVPVDGYINSSLVTKENRECAHEKPRSGNTEKEGVLKGCPTNTATQLTTHFVGLPSPRIVEMNLEYLDLGGLH